MFSQTWGRILLRWNRWHSIGEAIRPQSLRAVKPRPSRTVGRIVHCSPPHYSAYLISTTRTPTRRRILPQRFSQAPRRAADNVA